jgi:hypothetical protein
MRNNNLKNSKTNIKRPRISKTVRKKILELSDSGMSPPDIVKELNKNSHAPDIRSIQKIVKLAKPENNPLDRPWHMGTLKEYPLSPEVVAKIFEIKDTQPPFNMTLLQLFSSVTFPGIITLRMALWISRLCLLPMSSAWLRLWSKEYSDEERMSELSNVSFDSSDLDADLAKLLKHPEFAMMDKDKLDIAIREMARDSGNNYLNMNMSLISKDSSTFAHNLSIDSKGYMRTLLEYLLKRQEAQE